MIEPARRTPLGGTGIVLPRLGVGFSSLGGLFAPVEDDAGCQLVQAALAAGIDYFDVAPSYGYGLAELRAGWAFAGLERGRFTLSTKVGKLVRAAETRPVDDPFVGAPPGVAVFDYTREGIVRSLAESLERLGLDGVDILYIHDPDDHLKVAVGEAFPVLAEWRDQGIVRAIGFGMNDAAALEWAVERTDPDVILAANCYTLLDRSAARSLFPLCERRKIAVVAGGPFSSGILADPLNRPFYDYRPAPPAIREKARALQQTTEAHGVPLRVAALQFVARHPAITSVLVGARDAAEFRAAIDALTSHVPGALWEELDAALLAEPELTAT